MSAILIDQKVIHYEVLGRGRPLVFLHTWLGSWRYWVPVMQPASANFRTYGLDLWGYGDSTHAEEHYTFDQQEKLLDDFLEQMGVARLALVGHGLGAIVAINFAIMYPDKVDRLMLISYPLESKMMNSRLFNASPANMAEWLLKRTPENEPVRAEMKKIDPLASSTSFAALSSLPLHNLWKQVSRPCLLVHGLNDPAVAPPTLDHFAETPEHSHLISFDQSGHFPMIDESNKFNRLLADFLALPGGASPSQLQIKEEWKRRVR